MKFLIVEDNERMRRMIKTVVADRFDTVYECSDGSQARGSYAQYEPDWVPMDVVSSYVNELFNTAGGTPTVAEK